MDIQIQEALSYDDVLLAPSYSEVLPGNTTITTTLAAGLKLNIPIMSAAMDTVTEENMAIAIALQGGAGVIHRNMKPEEQAHQVGKVKRFLNWVIEKPVTVSVGSTIREVRNVMDQAGVTGLPVLKNGKLCGIITERDLKFNDNMEERVDAVMTTKLVLETGKPTEKTVKEKFNKHRIEKLPVVDEEGHLTGLITVRDMEKNREYPQAALDQTGCLLVGAAVGPRDWQRRLPLLLRSRVDFIILDTAHGASLESLKALESIKKTYPQTIVIGGNVANGDTTRCVVDAGSDAVKVGVGSGSIDQYRGLR